MSRLADLESSLSGLQPGARREFLRLLGLGGLAFFLSGCEKLFPKTFTRPAGVHNLGEVRYLLFSKQHIPRVNILLFRDDQGWSALSTRCTYQGCGLSYQDQLLTCPCCGSAFSHMGLVARGPATLPLPWYELFYQDNHLFVDAGKVANKDYRYTTQEIEVALERLRQQVASENIQPGTRIPEILMGRGDRYVYDEERDVEEFGVIPEDVLSSMTDTDHKSSRRRRGRKR